MITLLLFAATVAQPKWSGTLCVSDAAIVEHRQTGCSATTSSLVVVAPGKPLLWRSASGDRFVALRPATRDVDLASANGTIAFSIAPPRTKRRGVADPTSVTIARADKSVSWRFRVPASARPHPFTIAVEPGAYSLTVDGPHARPLQRGPINVVAATEKIADLGQLRLEGALLVRGRVADAATRRPVGGAFVSTEDRKVSATTTDDGVFELEVVTPPPWRIVTAHSAFATNIAEIARTDDDTLFLPIELHRGSTLVVDLELPPGIEHAKVSLFRKREKLDEREAGEERRVSFVKVDPCDYTIVVRGDGPLEQKRVNVHVADVPETLVAITIAPTMIDARVMHGSERLPHAHLVITQQTGLKGEATVDADGELRMTAWEHGTFLVQVEHEALPAPFQTLKELDDTSVAQWQLVVPDQRLVGHVVDAETGAGVPEATVQLESSGNGMSFSRSLTTDRGGNFEFVGTPGEQTITVWAAGYAVARDIRFTLDESQKVHDVVVRVQKQDTLELSVVDASGSPIADAIVLSDLANGGNEYDFIGHTDASGVVRVSIRGDSSKLVYVVPTAGSFAIAAIARDQRHITVPAPVASMNVIARTTTGEAATNVSLLLKYNGAFVPMAVARLVQRTSGTFRTDITGQATLRSLPAGIYGIWPYQTPEEADAIVRGLAAAPAPVEVALTAGRADVRLTFKSIEKP